MSQSLQLLNGQRRHIWPSRPDKSLPASFFQHTVCTVPGNVSLQLRQYQKSFLVQTSYPKTSFWELLVLSSLIPSHPSGPFPAWGCPRPPVPMLFSKAHPNGVKASWLLAVICGSGMFPQTCLQVLRYLPVSIVGRVASNSVVSYVNNIIDFITSLQFCFTTSSIGIRVKRQLINSV